MQKDGAFLSPRGLRFLLWGAIGLLLLSSPIFWALFLQMRENAHMKKLFEHVQRLIRQDGLPLSPGAMARKPPPTRENAAPIYQNIFANFHQNPQWGSMELTATPLLTGNGTFSKTKRLSTKRLWPMCRPQASSFL